MARIRTRERWARVSAKRMVPGRCAPMRRHGLRDRCGSTCRRAARQTLIICTARASPMGDGHVMMESMIMMRIERCLVARVFTTF